MRPSTPLIDRINQLLAAISQVGLKLVENHSCQMQCANGLICVVETLPETERAFGYIALSRLPNADVSRAALMQEALSLNLQLQKEDVLSIVYDKRIDHITLCSQCDVMDVNIDEFDHWLGNLIEKSDYIRSKLIESGLQASLNKTQEQRRKALIHKQEMKRSQKKPPAKKQVVTEQSLQHAVRSAQLFRL